MSEQQQSPSARLAFEDLIRTEIYLMQTAKHNRRWDMILTLVTTIGALLVASLSGASLILAINWWSRS